MTEAVVWSEDFIWKAYREATIQPNKTEIARALGITYGTLTTWAEAVPAFNNAIEAGLADKKRDLLLPSDTLPEYVATMDEEAKEKWEELVALEKLGGKNAALVQLDANQPLKQRLFVHALSVTPYAIEYVCRVLGVSKTQLDKWIATDPKFVKLLEEIQFAKKNFVESRFLQLVSLGSEKATIAANQTLNADRGYGQKLTVSGQVNHVVGMIDLTQLDLPVDTLSTIVQAIQAKGMVDMDGMLIESALPPT